jgi:hypothetical protein
MRAINTYPALAYRRLLLLRRDRPPPSRVMAHWDRSESF